MQKIRRVEDAAATGCDFFVAKAVDLVQELALARAGVHNVAVAVAECRQHHASVGIDGSIGRRLRTVAEGGNTPVGHNQPSLAQAVHRGHFCPAFTQNAGGNQPRQLCDIPDYQGFAHRYFSFLINSTDLIISGCM